MDGALCRSSGPFFRSFTTRTTPTKGTKEHSGNRGSAELEFAPGDKHCRNLDHPQAACHAETVKKAPKKSRSSRAPRIRVPNSERALFTVNESRFVGVLQRLSLTGGSAVLSKGPIPHGTMGDIALSTVYGKVSAHIEFLHSGADGVPLAQAFRFLAMEDASARRFEAAAKQMIAEGYSDAPPKTSTLSMPASEGLGLLLNSVRRLAATIVANRASAKS